MFFLKKSKAEDIEHYRIMNMVRELDEFNFYTVLPETKGIALVFFTGPHCSSCHHLRDLLNTQAHLFDEVFPSFSTFEVKADKASALVNEFNVFHLPTMFLYKHGEYHCEIQAQAHPKMIIEAIRSALNKPAEEEP